MSKILVNVDTGTSDAYGTLLPISHFLNGQIIKGLNITQNSPIGMSVLVNPGSGQILSGSGATQFGRFIAVDSTQAVTISTASGSNPRYDSIIAYYDTGATPTGTNNPNMVIFTSVDGTPSGSPSVPSDVAIQSAIGAGKPFIRLAKVLVGTSVTTIDNSKITDTRSFVKPQGTEGWTGLSGVPSTITNNGNHSTDLTFTGVDLTPTLSEGMRLRTTRTVPAPIQCATFDGTNDYFSKSSPAGMTFTDDFVVSAWVKLSSYNVAGIVSRFNGTSGWDLIVGGGGILELRGFNAGGGNITKIGTYQSIPLNKWVHIAAQLDMSSATVTGGTANYFMIDGVDVPIVRTQTGTNPASLIQAGNLEIGSTNAGAFFPGKIAQVAIYSAKVTQATIKASMNQGLTGSETSLVSAYSLSNSLEDLSANNNDLTANGGVLATTADSPFGNSGASTTLEYGIVMSKPVYSGGDTTMTVQTPEGCAIPTSGGISSVDYSSASVPFGFPRNRGRWDVVAKFNTLVVGGSLAQNTWKNDVGFRGIKAPIGIWEALYSTTPTAYKASSASFDIKTTLSTTNNSETDNDMTAFIQNEQNAAGLISNRVTLSRQKELTFTIQTPLYLNLLTTRVGGVDSYGWLDSESPTIITLKNSYV